MKYSTASKSDGIAFVPQAFLYFRQFLMDANVLESENT